MAFKERLLRSYLEGNPATVRYIHEYQPLLSELFEHPKFRFDFSAQVKDAIISATYHLLPRLFPRMFKKS